MRLIGLLLILIRSFNLLLMWGFIYNMPLSPSPPGARSQVVLTQSGPALTKPGETHKPQCAASGFTLSSTWMGWIRQEPGKGLEWLADYYSEGSKYYASSVQGPFTASQDSTSFSLQTTGLRAEDPAVYYCARHTARGSESELSQKPPPAVTARRVRCCGREPARDCPGQAMGAARRKSPWLEILADWCSFGIGFTHSPWNPSEHHAGCWKDLFSLPPPHPPAPPFSVPVTQT
ncbi:unnamed protein product [Natator depressus]